MRRSLLTVGPLVRVRFEQRRSAQCSHRHRRAQTQLLLHHPPPPSTPFHSTSTCPLPPPLSSPPLPCTPPPPKLPPPSPLPHSSEAVLRRGCDGGDAHAFSRTADAVDTSPRPPRQVAQWRFHVEGRLWQRGPQSSLRHSSASTLLLPLPHPLLLVYVLPPLQLCVLSPCIPAYLLRVTRPLHFSSLLPTPLIPQFLCPSTTAGATLLC